MAGATRVYTLFDDAMISMRYAQNLAAGKGLTWNVGLPPVEGFTNPSWTLWMAFVQLIGVSPPAAGLWVSLSSAGLVFGSAFAIRALARQMYPEDRPLTVLAFWATATYYPLVFWSLRGMEVGLATLLLSIAVLLSLHLQTRFERRRLALLAGVLCLAVLTRLELLAPAGLIAAFLALRIPHQRRAIGWGLAAPLLGTIAGATALRFAYFGEWLPNTYYLKLGGVALGTRLARGALGLASVSAIHLGGLLLFVAFGLWQRRGRLRAEEALLLALYSLLSGYSMWVGGDAWDFYGFANRFVTPGVPLLMLLALRFVTEAIARRDGRALCWLATTFVLLAGLDWLPGATEETRPAVLRGVASLLPALALLGAGCLVERRAAAHLQALVAGALLLGSSLNPVAGALLYGAPHSRGDKGWSAYGLLVRETTAADATVAVTWAGNASYFSDRITFDQLGKTDAIIAHGPNVSPVFRPGHSKWNLSYTFGNLAPDLIAGLYFATEADLTQLEARGYSQLMGNCYVRRGTRKVNVAKLRAGLLALSVDPRFSNTLCVRQVGGTAFPASWLPASSAIRGPWGCTGRGEGPRRGAGAPLTLRSTSPRR